MIISIVLIYYSLTTGTEWAMFMLFITWIPDIAIVAIVGDTILNSLKIKERSRNKEEGK